MADMHWTSSLPHTYTQDHLSGGDSQEHLTLGCLRLLAKLPVKPDMLRATNALASTRKKAQVGMYVAELRAH
jgi:hypothetical protein